MTSSPARGLPNAIWAVVLIWLLCVAGILYVRWDHLAAMNFIDPDDALRLVEVRDWMAGQSWFDVTQYRSHPPAGAPMHWSRLVDIPIAAFIGLFSLFAGQGLAERLALCAVPFLLLLGLFLILYRLTLRMTGKPLAGVTAALMLATSMSILIQYQALRIDHHGWQIALGTLAVLTTIALRDRPVAGGIWPGIILAFSLTIAVESLPLAVAIAGILALRYLRGAQAWSGLAAYLGALTGGGVLLLFGMLGWQRAMVPWCDSLSPAYIAPLAAVTVVMFAARTLPMGHLWQRLSILGVSGAAGAAIFLRFSGQCLAGPFSGLDPILYKLWYTSVSEGMPIWTQPADVCMLILLPGLLGLIGTALAIRCDAAERRLPWIELLILQAATFVVSLFIMRAMGLSHVLALPGTAWLVLNALAATRRLRTAAGRILAGFCCFVLTPLGGEVVASAAIPAVADNSTSDRFVCPGPNGLAQLNDMPPTVLFAPLDISAHLLVYTHQSVIATGHHRNVAGMVAVIRGFIAPPDKARAIIAATPARYLAICTGENEIRHYVRDFPRSLAATLVKGPAPEWLVPVPRAARKDVNLYRIVREDQAVTKRIATPFMQ